MSVAIPPVPARTGAVRTPWAATGVRVPLGTGYRAAPAQVRLLFLNNLNNEAVSMSGCGCLI